MYIVKQSYEILGRPSTLEEAWAFVAKAARNCYRSEKTRADESEEAFCKRVLLKSYDYDKNHMSPFEFGVVHLHEEWDKDHVSILRSHYEHNPYSRVTIRATNNPSGINHIWVTTTLRVILENYYESDLIYICKPTMYHPKWRSYKLVTSVGIMAELTRHRDLSFCVESTRYCNYSSDKFGRELTMIQPCWCCDLSGQHFIDPVPEDSHMAWVNPLIRDEKDYMHYTQDLKWTAQEAAIYLPKDTKTTIIMGGFSDSLYHMFRLRAEEASGPVHPMMKELMAPLYKDSFEYVDPEY